MLPKMAGEDVFGRKSSEILTNVYRLCYPEKRFISDKGYDEDGVSSVFPREPGMVESRQQRLRNPITSELESPKQGK